MVLALAHGAFRHAPELAETADSRIAPSNLAYALPTAEREALTSPDPTAAMAACRREHGELPTIDLSYCQGQGGARIVP